MTKELAIKILSTRDRYGCLCGWTSGYTEALDMAIEALKERPKGEWIYCEDEYGTDGYRCSNCGRHIPWDYQHKFINFIDDYHTCPFCGARMKGADDE